MKSYLYEGFNAHARIEPLRHAFRYRAWFLEIDLSDLGLLTKKNKLFGYNHFCLFSIYDRDYLNQGPGSIKDKLYIYLKEEHLETAIERITLITSPRCLGYVFNPVSFYLCFDANDRLRCAAAEVNNTFGEKHLYWLKQPEIKEENTYVFREQKAFHVSPFFDRTGQYEFKFLIKPKSICIQINLFKNSKPVLLSTLSGDQKELSAFALLKNLFLMPGSIFLTLARIHWQALKLFFIHKLPHFSKPVPENAYTIRKMAPKVWQKFSLKMIHSFLMKASQGCLRLQLPSGEERFYGEKKTVPTAEIQVHHYRLFTRLIQNAGIGLGEAYMDRDWDSPDLTGTLKFFIDNKPKPRKQLKVLEYAGNSLNRLRHFQRKNTLQNSKKNIQDHYDLGNAFFSQFLDSSMTYSSALFQNADQTLEAAQKNKIQSIIAKARIRPEHHVLEIGCGWGAFAIEAVKQTGCRVTGLTLSEEQLRFARDRVQREGLEDKIHFKLCDYRTIDRPYDRIVSIEMLEAVGHENFKYFFRAISRALKPDGLAVIQVISIPDQRYESYRRSADWIQKHIFPGGHLPSLSALCHVMTSYSTLHLEHVENMGVHYARTLREWKLRFTASKARIRELGYSERMIRAWDYYFSYCEAAFAKHHLFNYQLIFSHAGNPLLMETSKREGIQDAHSL